VARPIPLEAPVMTMTCSCSGFSFARNRASSAATTPLIADVF
jgi:hypothetical protein